MRQSILLAFAALSTGVFAQSVSNNGRCGVSNGGLRCTGSTFGSCCSQYGWCGTTTGHCGEGCDSRYGQCTTSTGGSSPKISTDGSCGGSKGQTCQESTFGNCCSQYNYCGRTTPYCGTGCNPSFGSCNGLQSSSRLTSSTLRSVVRSSSAVQSSIPSSSTSAASPTSSAKISTNARCGNTQGATGGFTCIGSTFGSCCSQYGYCGQTTAYCGTGCQPGFGQCTSVSSSIQSSSSKTSSRSLSQVLSSSSSIISASSQESSSSGVTTSISSSQLSSGVQSGISSSNTQGDFASSSSVSSSEVQSSTAQSSSSASPLASSSVSSSVVSSASIPESTSSAVVLSMSTQGDVTSSSHVLSSEMHSSTAHSFSSASSSEPSSAISSSSASTEAASISVVITSSSAELSSTISSVPISSSDVSSTLVQSTSSAISSESSSFQSIATSSSTPDISSSSMGPSSSLSTISVTTMDAQISSTPEPTSSSIMIESSSSIIVSSSVSSSCVPLQTNYIRNPGFEAGVKGDWDEGTMGVWSLSASAARWVTTGGTASGAGTGVWPNIGRTSNSFAFRGTPAPYSVNVLELSQKVVVPAGTKVTAGVWIKLLVFPSTRHVFKLFLDNTQVGASFSPPLTDTWYYLTSTQEYTMSGTAAHTIRLELSSEENSPGRNLFIVDDFELLRVPEPSESLECGPAAPEPPPTCLSAPENYLGPDGGFESGLISPWTQYLGSWTGDVLSGSTNSGTYHYRGSQGAVPGSSLTLRMFDVRIPSGTSVRCNAFIKTLKTGYATYALYIDAVPCMGYGAFGPMTAYANARAGSNNARTITVSGDTHIFDLHISSSDVIGPIFDLDDVIIAPSSGPDGEPVC